MEARSGFFVLLLSSTHYLSTCQDQVILGGPTHISLTDSQGKAQCVLSGFSLFNLFYVGYQVAPAELESLLIQHEEVKDVGVTSIPDTCRGELPVAFIVACSKHSRLTESALQAYISKRVANHKQLTGGVVFVDEIPKTLSGKILRRQLKLQAAGALSAI